MEIEGKVVGTSDDRPRALPSTENLPDERETKDVKRTATLEHKDAPLVTGKRAERDE